MCSRRFPAWDDLAHHVLYFNGPRPLVSAWVGARKGDGHKICPWLIQKHSPGRRKSNIKGQHELKRIVKTPTAIMKGRPHPMENIFHVCHAGWLSLPGWSRRRSCCCCCSVLVTGSRRWLPCAAVGGRLGMAGSGEECAQRLSSGLFAGSGSAGKSRG